MTPSLWLLLCLCWHRLTFPLVSHFLSVFCPLRLFASGEPLPECRRYVEVRNITKGDCRLDNVEVSFCRGRCLSRTDVILEVREGT